MRHFGVLHPPLPNLLAFSGLVLFPISLKLGWVRGIRDTEPLDTEESLRDMSDVESILSKLNIVIEDRSDI
ncbi:hypothetical protein AHAS_Ahas06G0142900 [Arachis hypogaea]